MAAISADRQARLQEILADALGAWLARVENLDGLTEEERQVLVSVRVSAVGVMYAAQWGDGFRCGALARATPEGAFEDLDQHARFRPEAREEPRRVVAATRLVLDSDPVVIERLP